jgi:peptidoglycan/xylan/chitin deacetylase (PgdA/CDA1 family)
MSLTDNRLILAYHSVSPTWQVDTSVTPERLREQLLLLQSKGYRGVTLSEALRTPKRHKVMVPTFDDAHISVYTVAKPILQELGVPGTIFVPTDYPDSGRLMAWKGYDEWVGTPHEEELACMSWDQLREVADAGWEIGAHTCSHPHLPQLDADGIRLELTASKAACEREMAGRCRSLAYPFGEADDRVRAAARDAGYEVAAGLSSAAFVARDRFDWPRVGVWHGEPDWRFRLKVSGVTDRLRGSRPVTALDGVRRRLPLPR